MAPPIRLIFRYTKPVSARWWVGLFPGLALLAMILGLNFVGDGLQDVLDPRGRADHD
jgi:ABC-type dipeptide/oligopeptide/nickel transport system permease subunit